MKTVSLVTLGLSLLALSAGCSAADDESGGAAAALETPRAMLICMSPVGHPFNGNGTVWLADVAGSKEAPHDTFVTKTTAFYWHGTPLVPFNGKTTGTQWKVTHDDGGDGVHLVASGNNETVTVDLRDVPIAGFDGSLRHVAADGTAEDVTIERGQECELQPDFGAQQ